MNRSQELLDILEASSVAEVEDIISELLSTHFHGEDLPMPSVKIKNNLSAGWLASCVYRRSNPGTSEIEVQKAAIEDNDTLRRVLAHELIHHWQYVKSDMTAELQRRQLGIKTDAHGDDFREWAARINSAEGSDYVTTKSDTTYVVNHTKEFYVLIEPSGDEYGYAFAARPSAKQKEDIKDRKHRNAARLFKTSNHRFTAGVPIKRWGTAIPRDEETKAVLRDMYLTGEDVDL